ncbi:MAG TPA: superoxide dismutase [Candidatus Binatia bacterium]|nr:superoxide dismutase [Candidatus Binatia bacterium]
MPFQLPELPYALDALAPHISAETLKFHHGKHHAKYVDTLNSLTKGTEWAGRPLEDVVRKAEPGPLANNAGQHWNHSFYWQCLSPKGGGDPSGKLADQIRRGFGSFDDFRREFNAAASDLFGSGWAWLVREPSGNVSVKTTPNAGSPLLHGWTPLLTCDMWEHAYYIDYRHAKKRYLEGFWSVVNWDFATRQL